ncbi:MULTISPECIES: ATP-dependent zinc metalloprotease FtsH [Lachnospiraceae]|jgi:cell division protease FtsH|uniref:ATP-dependent zinc metalloprotease FtsH n=1 Tax=Faecalicatena acetigenes TaxID=2981790 RepID=A0ABT2TG98_9FIRM|nr:MULTISPECIES: ATP-dependent zinc metalloprotease FtsH [Lachnospiraceae]MCU6748689.1 ATP-dependent zinc metalloprotease FtsH [Faecalicatena acetigenes]RGT71834.1 ATP-dependent metallopeptidase FtsH/Yme1/Tma family protein [Ruminococcus sp. AF18-22]SCI58839.1 ATP-dependent zinc metalloprotease FtsH [uncultured Clostridium sp.]
MDNQNNHKDPKNNRQGWGVILVTTLLVTFIVMGLYSLMKDNNPEEISYDKFLELVDDKKVEEVMIDTSKIYITLKEDAKTESRQSGNTAEDLVGQLEESVKGNGTKQKEPDYYTGTVNDESLTERLEKAGVKFSAKIPDTLSSMLFELFITLVLPILMVVVLFNFVMRRVSKGGGMMGIGKSNAKVYVEKETGVTFQDVAGQDEAKESLQEVVDFLHNPGKYTGIGAKLPKGALLVGPPGTGKTLLAKAVAGEAKVPFFSLSGSAFVEMYVGVGASRVRDLFKQAQQMAPCIVFIDEIDAIGKTRDTMMGGNDEREQTLNQLLAEMDGFDTNKGLLLLAATNRPEVLDPALLRPGRFDRRIIVDKPDLKGRIDVLKVHAKDVKMDETVDLEAIALATSGAVGSDLANMINEAAINAVKNGRQVVSQKDLFEAVEVVLVGKEKKDRIMSKEERRIVSYHEVGHALVTALQKNTEPVQKITIVPRTMGALGYVMQTPEEEKFLNTKKELEAMLVVALGGRAAEEIVFDTVTTGASNDIEKATKIARAMITQYGMSEKFGLIGLESIQNRYLDGRPVLNCGDATAAEIDAEVMKILKAAYEEAKRLLRDNREALDKISDFLIEKETITGKEFMEIFRQVQGIDESEEKQEETEEQKEGEQEGRITMKPAEAEE